MALTNKLTAIGNAIREKNNTTELLTLDEMPVAISNIETGGGSGGADIPEEAFNISGDCSYRFSSGGWDWFIKNYGNKISTNNIINATNMFKESKAENIPFEFNFNSADTIQMFYNCQNLKSIAGINGSIKATREMFYNCFNLRYLPPMNLDVSLITNYSYCRTMFQNCCSLRDIPEEFLGLFNKGWTSQTSHFLYSAFNNCYCLNELNSLMAGMGAAINNIFNYTFNGCYRLKNVTFKMLENNTPQIAKWKNQTISLVNVGYSLNKYMILDYNSGITADKEIKDDATYQALKDDVDSFTTNGEYSRYNHTSAVNTINSLPDTSAYLASAGGTNTITFTGAAGSLTDGGAINTLTEEEIAVAAAKGWTVSFV